MKQRQTTDERLKRRIYNHKKSDAKKRGIKFTLRYEDIKWPAACPALGIKLAYSRRRRSGPRPNSPSFDRINPKRGYTPDNVVIVSTRANAMKSDANTRELWLVADFYWRLEKKRRNANSHRRRRG